MKHHLEKLEDYLRRNSFSGYDPYDALNSPLAGILSFGTKYGRIAMTQAMRRLPFNLRPFIGIKKGHNPKGLGLFLWGYAKLYAIEKNPQYLEQISFLLDRLDELKSRDCSGNGWGYNFDWQSRAFFVPKYTPTIVNSSFIGHALLDTWQHTGMQQALDLALPIANFILKDLHRTKDGDTFCFSYTPIDQTAVHNANLLGASLLIRLYQLTGESALKTAALESLAYTMKYQHEDGSWFYAETKMQSWIDSFHTGFNLEAIRHFLKIGEAQEYRPGFDKGVKFYADNFFLDDGTPKYYHDRVYPIDIHAPAEAIVFFAGEGDRYRDLTDRVLTWSLDNLYDQSGYFYFRKGPRFTNKIPYMRWAQAWAFHALTEYRFQRWLRETKDA